jgi:hypothetical protein
VDGVIASAKGTVRKGDDTAPPLCFTIVFKSYVERAPVTFSSPTQVRSDYANFFDGIRALIGLEMVTAENSSGTPFMSV